MKQDERLTIFGEHEDKTVDQMLNCLDNEYVVRAALLADGHYGYGVPIGGTIAYRNAISPSGVGFDIACGNNAVLTDMPGSELRENIQQIMDDVWSTLSFGVGRKNNERVEHELFDTSNSVWKLEAAKPLREKAVAQLGTIGSGNHYVDLFTDEQDRVWIGVHFGSRGLGFGLAHWFLKAAGAPADKMDAPPCVLPTASDLGAQYVQAMTLGGRYAYAGRDWVCSKVASLLGAEILEEVHNHHNFSWMEEHDGEQVWVVRKGSTPAFPGQKGFVGGTMCENAVILEGVDSETSKQALYSTVHGAGRVLGRKMATGVTKKNKETGEIRVVREPMVTQEMMRTAVQDAKVELRGAGVDESPHCYKRLPAVLAAMGDSIRVLHTLTPVGVAMAGDEFDPYKD
jgi:tRNA-splicing ligase RtcB (3'-phosphate/5'-hydroxy nucleic acid ligase)